jgi:hypothetical protein
MADKTQNRRQQIQDQIEHILNDFAPEGARLSEIMARLDPPAPEYTVQRLLSALQATGRITRIGVKKGARYSVTAASPPVTTTAEPYIPISDESQRVKDSIRRPLHERQPVAYAPHFLSDYAPNQSFYLSRSLREKLAQIGTSAVADKPAGTYARQILERLLIDLSWNSSRVRAARSGAPARHFCVGV